MTTRKRYPEKYKEFIQFEAYRHNPYADKMTGIGRFKLKHKEGYLVPLTETSGMPIKVKVAAFENQEMQVGYKSDGDWTTMDRRQYAKMYIEFIGILIRDGIGLPGVRMLFFILKRLRVGSDIVQFTIAAAKAHTGYRNDKSIYEGLVDLIRMGVIARKEGTDEQFYINPQYIFRGKRENIMDNEDSVEIQ
jgi:hypothetical protein